MERLHPTVQYQESRPQTRGNVQLMIDTEAWGLRIQGGPSRDRDRDDVRMSSGATAILRPRIFASASLHILVPSISASPPYHHHTHTSRHLEVRITHISLSLHAPNHDTRRVSHGHSKAQTSPNTSAVRLYVKSALEAHCALWRASTVAARRPVSQ